MTAVHRRVQRELLPARRRARRRWTLPARPSVRVDTALPDALESMARSLRSGSSLRIAIAEAGAAAPTPLGEGLTDVAGAAARGRPLATAIDRWSSSTPGEGVALTAAALGLGAELGGAAARSLDGVAGTLRDRNGVRREVRALSTQARASAAVIGCAPVAFLLVVAAVDPSAVGFLVGSPVGLSCLASGLGFDAAGAWWMRCIVARAGTERDLVAAQQADVIDLFALALGAGLNLRLALTAVARHAPPAWAPALGVVVERVDRGQRVADALDVLVVVLGDPARSLVRVLAGAERYGTPLLPALERLALDARLDRRRRAEEAARRVPVKLLFPLVLCVLPAFGLLTVTPLLAGALDALRL
jgi:Flp pilus assembly protein TadB